MLLKLCDSVPPHNDDLVSFAVRAFLRMRFSYPLCASEILFPPLNCGSNAQPRGKKLSLTLVAGKGLLRIVVAHAQVLKFPDALLDLKRKKGRIE
jgi:hypothetical protein